MSINVIAMLYQYRYMVRNFNRGMVSKTNMLILEAIPRKLKLRFSLTSIVEIANLLSAFYSQNMLVQATAGLPVG